MINFCFKEGDYVLLCVDEHDYSAPQNTSYSYETWSIKDAKGKEIAPQVLHEWRKASHPMYPSSWGRTLLWVLPEDFEGNIIINDESTPWRDFLKELLHENPAKLRKQLDGAEFALQQLEDTIGRFLAKKVGYRELREAVR